MRDALGRMREQGVPADSRLCVAVVDALSSQGRGHLAAGAVTWLVAGHGHAQGYGHGKEGGYGGNGGDAGLASYSIPRILLLTASVPLVAALLSSAGAAGRPSDVVRVWMAYRGAEAAFGVGAGLSSGQGQEHGHGQGQSGLQDAVLGATRDSEGRGRGKG